MNDLGNSDIPGDDGIDLGELGIVADRAGNLPVRLTGAGTPSAVGGIAGAIAKGMLGRFFFGILSALMIGIFTNYLQIKAVGAFIAASLAMLGGWDMVPPKEAKDGTGGIIHRLRKVAPVPTTLADAGVDAGQEDAPRPRQSIASGIGSRMAAPVKEAIREPAKKVVNKVEEKVEEVQDTVEKAADKIAAGGQAAKGKLVEAREAAAERVSKAAAARARQADERGYNGSCPNCMKPMRVSLRGKGNYGCVRCGGNFSAAAIRAMGPPTGSGLFGGFR